jgi:sulfate adenylyltransferase
MAAADAHLLVHPVVGQTKPGDVDHYTRVRCYRGLMDSYEPGAATLSLLPLAMRMAGPREALWHALIRRNYGATHFIVGRDHAGPGTGRDGRPFYGPYDSQELVREHAAEVGIEMVPFRQMVYCPDTGEHLPDEAVPPGTRTLTLSGTQLRRRLAEGAELPDWFTPPAVARELRRRYPPRRQQGVTVFFTGLSGSGKSTLARALTARLEDAGRTVTLLDGDEVRRLLSAGLGFSREDIATNIARIAFVAAEVTRHGGIAVCAPIAPFAAVRADARDRVSATGDFVLVHVATPLAECERRDRKGLYARARAGEIRDFVGIDTPYEAPEDADLTLDTTGRNVDECLDAVWALLQKRGYGT